MRTSTITRRTAETDIRLVLDLDGGGKSEIDTGCGFLNHMLTLFARHGRFDLTVKCVGDTDVDDHHTVEDIGICLGLAFAEALGDMGGIVRYGNTLLPMDEALILTAVDIENSHHIVEGAFKSAARSLRAACAVDPTLNGEIPSTKGVL